MIDIEKIKEELKLLPDFDDQIMLQTVEGNTDPSYGTGRLSGFKETDFTIPLFPQLEYTNKVIDLLGMFRTRVMVLKPKRCYTYHRDLTKRIHIPVVTNDKCMFIIDDIVHRYPADGNYYEVDTTLPHTALNGSREDRIHIVGCI